MESVCVKSGRQEWGKIVMSFKIYYFVTKICSNIVIKEVGLMKRNKELPFTISKSFKPCSDLGH